VSRAALARTGLVAVRDGVAASTTRMPTTAEQDRVRLAIEGLSDHYAVAVERGPVTSAGPMAFILAIVAAAIALGAAGIATGLAAADGRADIATLAAVGAAPWLRRTLSLSQSGVIAGLGSLLGSVAGLGAAFAVLVALNRPWADLWPAPPRYPLVVPWLNLGIALLAVPVIAMLSAGLLTRSRLPIEQRRPT
jgi:putative ABC transport system permease protein